MDFQPFQILCLAHGDTALFAELIQMATPVGQTASTEVRRCWVRPLALVEPFSRVKILFQDPSAVQIYDLRDGSDLLWPAHLFRAAIDTEVVSLLASLADGKEQGGTRAIAQQKLREFIQRVWEYPTLTAEEGTPPLNEG